MYSNLKNKHLNSIDQKLEEFYEWYYQIFLENIYQSKNDKQKYEKESQKLKKIINKYVAWYEIRYPNHSINNVFLSESNPLNSPRIYLTGKEALKEEEQEFLDTVTSLSSWQDILSPKAFFQTLSDKEKEPLVVTYPKFIHIQNQKDPYDINSIHLTKKGKVLEGKLFLTEEQSDQFAINLKGFHIIKVWKLLKENERLSKSFEEELLQIERTIAQYHRKKELKEKFLNAIMLSILNQDTSNNISSKRAYLFAKEFHLNLDIPMSYGLDFNDNYLRYFINDYLKNGGNKDLVFQNIKEKITIQEALTYLPSDLFDNIVYTEKEQILHQRLVNVLSHHKEQKSASLKLQKSPSFYPVKNK